VQHAFAKNRDGLERASWDRLEIPREGLPCFTCHGRSYVLYVITVL
jgi:hypothetical protein